MPTKIAGVFDKHLKNLWYHSHMDKIRYPAVSTGKPPPVRAQFVWLSSPAATCCHIITAPDTSVLTMFVCPDWSSWGRRVCNRSSSGIIMSATAAVPVLSWLPPKHCQYYFVGQEILHTGSRHRIVERVLIKYTLKNIYYTYTCPPCPLSLSPMYGILTRKIFG